MSVVVDVQSNEDYEPSESEIQEYAKWLGMKFPEDEPFIWIAREGLKAPLPENWSACRSEKGELYYFNSKTGQSIWDHPLDDHFRELYANKKQSSGLQSMSKDAKENTVKFDTATEATPQIKRKDPSSSRSKMSTLKSLKLKKELPDDLRINFQESRNSNLDSCGQSAELVNATESVQRSSQIDHKVFTVVSDTCVADGSCVQTEKAREKDKINFIEQLDSQFQQFQAEKLKEHQNEKEVYEQKLKDSWIRSKSRLENIYEKKVVDCKNDLNTKFLAEKERLESEFSKNLQQLNDTLTHGFQEEAERIRSQLIERQEKAKAAAEKGWSLEINALERKFAKEKIDLEKQKDDELKAFSHQRALELEKLRTSQNDGIEILKGYAEEVKKTAAMFIETAREAYLEFEDALQRTQSNACKVGERMTGQLSQEMRQMCDTELKSIKDFYNSEISRIKNEFKNELMLMSVEHKTTSRSTQEKFNNKTEKQSPLLEITRIACQKLDHNLDTLNTENLTSAFPMTNIDEPESIHGNLEKAKPQNGGVSTLCDSLHNKENSFDPNVKLPRRYETAVPVLAVCQSSDDEEEESDVHLGSIPIKKDAQKDVGHSLKGLEGVSAVSPLNLESLKGEDLTAVITEALRKVFAGSPFIVSSTSGNSSRKQRRDLDFYLSPPATETIEAKRQRKMETFPVSLRDQKLLLVSERQRILEGRKFVETQRLSLDKRREQLKMTRRQWKQDVITAKGEGVRPSSRQGQVLNRLRAALENQLKGLEQDETILQDSEMWLLLKEQRLHELEQQINDLERSRVPNVSINSVDTTVLVTDYFKPSYGRSTCTRTSTYPAFGEDVVGKTQLGTLSPIYTIQLDKIARRLDEVTSMINLQKQNQQQRKKRLYQEKGENGKRRQPEKKNPKDIDFDFVEMQRF